MTDFKINGGRKLYGSINVNSSKNGAMGLMCAALINKGETIIHNIPKIEEINRMFEVFESIGVSIKYISDSSVKIQPPTKWDLGSINKEAASRMRSILMLMGVFVNYKNEFELPYSGGCKMGSRTIAAHRHGLEELGVKVEVLDDTYKLSNNGLLKNREIIMYEASDTATINLLLAAAKIPGKTVIKYAPPNYQVQDVCFFLQNLGIRIDGVGTHILTVYGVDDINKEVEHYNSEDPIEAMFFVTTAITTESKLQINRCPIRFIEIEMQKLKYMGLKFDISGKYLSDNKKTELVDIIIDAESSNLVALNDKIHPLPYPGLNVDNLPFFAAIATKANGRTLIHDWMWESRAIHFTELNKLGANVKMLDPHRVEIFGKTDLKGAQIICPPALRPAAVILVAMLGAGGESFLRSIYTIARGYEDLANRLNEIGADIKIIDGDLNGDAS